MAIDDGTLQQFESALWDEPGTGVVAILDGASVPGLRGQLRKAWPARVECLMGAAGPKRMPVRRRRRR